MTIKSFYYTAEDSNVVRVEAESYEQITTTSDGGDCPGILYRITFDQNWVETQYGPYVEGVERSIPRTIDRRGPITGPEHEFDGSTAIARIFVGTNQAPIGWTVQRTRNAIPTDSLPPTNVSIVALEEEPEYCRGSSSCRTEFYRSGQVIHAIDYCPPISEEPPDDCCCDCCDELAAIAQTIRV